MSRRSVSLPRVFSTRHIRWHEFDWHVLLIAMALLGMGLIFVSAVAGSKGNELSQAVNFDAHRQKVALTLPLILAGLLVRPAWLARNTVWIYLGCLGFLVAVYVVGEERNHAQRWIQLPGFDLQPSELAKVGVILMLARLLAANRLERLEDWGKPLAVVAIHMVLVAGQPDLGTALTLVPVTLGMLYLAGARARTLIGLCLFGVLMGWMAKSADMVRTYQMERIETWAGAFDAEGAIALRNGPGFHQYQSRLAIGNGWWLGRGLGQGVANETGLLPERESDSIFAVVAEESGFLGAVGVLLL